MADQIGVNDIAKHYIRTALDAGRRLDAAFKKCDSYASLFSNEIQILRLQLTTTCEKLWFMDPNKYGNQVEELLWKKGYYETVALTKQLSKKHPITEEVRAQIQNHLLSGQNLFYRLLWRLSRETDPARRPSQYNYVTGITAVQHLSHSINLLAWTPVTARFWQRCLLWQGDLARYQLELGRGDVASVFPLAEHFYTQAMLCDVDQGLPFNQLATLHSLIKPHLSLEPVFYYIRCMAAAKPFEGGEKNFKKLLERIQRYSANESKAHDLQLEKVAILVVNLVRSFYVEDTNGNSEIPKFCGELWKELGLWLDMQLYKPNKEDKEEGQELFFLAGLVLLCLDKVNKNLNANSDSDSDGLSALALNAFALSLLSLYLRHAALRIKVLRNTLGMGDLLGGKVKKAALRKRARRKPQDGSDDSDIFLSDSDEEDSEPSFAQSKAKVSPDEWAEKINNALQAQGLMCGIQTLLDWIAFNAETLSQAGDSVLSLWQHVALAYNYLCLQPVAETETKTYATWQDVLLNGVNTLLESQSKIQWEPFKILGVSAQKTVRYSRLVKSLNTVARLPISPLELQLATSLFLYEDELPKTTFPPPPKVTSPPPPPFRSSIATTTDDKTRTPSPKDLMQNMAELWLRSEVQSLEKRLGKMPQRQIPPVLVPDTSAMTKYLNLIKALAQSRKALIVIPESVVVDLDAIKKESSEARDVTRWIERQVQEGHRGLRVQKPHEKLPLPLVRYPRKKDKLWSFFQILDLCHYLVQQQKSSDTPLVVLLTGDSATFESVPGEQSPVGLSDSMGLGLEHIQEFCEKWNIIPK